MNIFHLVSLCKSRIYKSFLFFIFLFLGSISWADTAELTLSGTYSNYRFDKTNGDYKVTLTGDVTINVMNAGIVTFVLNGYNLVINDLWMGYSDSNNASLTALSCQITIDGTGGGTAIINGLHQTSGGQTSGNKIAAQNGAVLDVENSDFTLSDSFLTYDSTSCQSSDIPVWTGSVSTDWSNTSNWNGNKLPTIFAKISKLDSGVYPVVTSSDTISLSYITIESDASLTVANGSMTLSKTITNAGTVDIQGGTVDCSSISNSGTFNVSTGAFAGSITNLGTASLSNCTLSSSSITNSGTLDFKGGTYPSDITNEGGITFSSGNTTLTGSFTSTNTSATIYITEGKVTFTEDLDITANNTKIYSSISMIGGSLTVENLNITGSSKDHIALNIEGGTFTVNGTYTVEKCRSIFTGGTSTFTGAFSNQSESNVYFTGGEEVCSSTFTNYGRVYLGSSTAYFNGDFTNYYSVYTNSDTGGTFTFNGNVVNEDVSDSDKPAFDFPFCTLIFNGDADFTNVCSNTLVDGSKVQINKTFILPTANTSLSFYDLSLGASGVLDIQDHTIVVSNSYDNLGTITSNGSTACNASTFPTGSKDHGKWIYTDGTLTPLNDLVFYNIDITSNVNISGSFLSNSYNTKEGVITVDTSNDSSTLTLTGTTSFYGPIVMKEDLAFSQGTNDLTIGNTITGPAVSFYGTGDTDSGTTYLAASTLTTTSEQVYETPVSISSGTATLSGTNITFRKAIAGSSGTKLIVDGSLCNLDGGSVTVPYQEYKCPLAFGASITFSGNIDYTSVTSFKTPVIGFLLNYEGDGTSVAFPASNTDFSNLYRVTFGSGSTESISLSGDLPIKYYSSTYTGTALAINQNCTLNSTANITIYGSVLNNGSFTCSSGTVTLTEANPSDSSTTYLSAKVSGENTFYNFVASYVDVDFLEANTFTNLTLKGYGNTFAFAKGETQKVTSSFTVTGKNGTTSNNINLGYLNLTSYDDGSEGEDKRWHITPPSDVSKTSISYAYISYSYASQNMKSCKRVSFTNKGNNVNWFEASYFFTGIGSTDWNVCDNWKEGSEGDWTTVNVVPSCDDYAATIRVYGASILDAPSDIHVSSFVIDSSSQFNLNDYNLDSSSLNVEGTIHLSTTSSLPSSVTYGTNSTVEYYIADNSSCSSLHSSSYANLILTEGSYNLSGLTVSSTLTIDTEYGPSASKSYGDINLSGSFTKVYLENGKDVSLTSTKSITLDKNNSSDGSYTINLDSLTVNASSTIKVPVNTVGKQIYNGSVTYNKKTVDSLGNEISISLATSGSAITFNGTVSCAENVKFEATGDTYSSDNTEYLINFTKGFASGISHNIELDSSSNIYGSNSFESFVCKSQGVYIRFENGKTQTITGEVSESLATDASFMIKGGVDPGDDESTEYYVHLYPLDESSSTPWYINVPVDYVSVSYADILNSYSNKNIIGGVTTSYDGGNTTNWFGIYVWVGASNDSWSTVDNWRCASPNALDQLGAVNYVPSYTNGSETIYVQKTSNGHDLDFNKAFASVVNVSLSSLIVTSGNTLDIGSSLVKYSGSITNNGTIKIGSNASFSHVVDGNQEEPNLINGSDSVISYYDITGGSLPWITSYVNLVLESSFVSGSCDSLSVEEDFTTSGTTSQSLTSTGDITIEGKSNLDSSISLTSGGNITLKGAITSSKDVTLEANNIYLKSSLSGSSSTLNIKLASSTGLFKTDPGVDLTCTNLLETSESSNQAFMIGGSLNATGTVSFKNDVFFYSSSSSSSSIKGSLSFYKTLYIASPSSHTYNLSGSLTCKNFVLLGGSVSLPSGFDMTVKSDMVLLKGNESIFNDTTNNISGLFRYIRVNGQEGVDTASSSLSSLPTSYPDNTSSFPDGTINSYAGSMNFEGSCSITVNGNFYDNGVNLTSNNAINVTNSSGFTEFYNCSLKNVSCTKDASACENVTNSGSNTNVYFSRPYFSDCYTTYDNIIHVAFVDKDGNDAYIKNTNGEITNALQYMKFYDDSNEYTYSAFIYESGSEVSLPTRDLHEFYLKASSSIYWNTGATGSSYGEEDGTDRQGNHQTAVPCINLIKGSSACFATLRDSHGNRIGHYTGSKTDINTTGSEGYIYRKVSDKCSPVLAGVYYGQELHVTNPNEQLPYDGHNFIELHYSESVSVPGIALGSTNATNIRPTITESDNTTLNIGQLIRNTKSSGFTTNSNSNSLHVIGLCEIEGGNVSFGSNGVSVTDACALYRDFAVTSADAYNGNHSFQSCRLRISIAGYMSGKVSIGSYSYNKYDYYIADSASCTVPSGNVYVKSHGNDTSYNDLITDKEGNYLSVNNSTFAVTSRDEELYGAWDISCPEFAFSKDKVDGFDEYNYTEVSCSSTSGTVVDRIEFHVFDNKYDGNPKWISREGWKSGNSLYRDDSYAADKFGGSRAFDTDVTRRTAGGLRYSTLYNKASYFKYEPKKNQTSVSLNFESSTITMGVENVIFTPIDDSTGYNEPSDPEGLYFALSVNNKNLSLRSTVTYSYDGDAYVTDLAGNLLKTDTLNSYDQSSIKMALSVGYVKSDKDKSTVGNKLYVVFDSKIILDTINLRTDLAGNTEEKNAAEGLLETLSFVDHSGASLTGDRALKIVSVPTNGTSISPVFQNEFYTGIILTLSRDITMWDLQNVYLKASVSDQHYNHSNALDYVTYIMNSEGYYVTNNSAHPISDFAVNIIDPLYAYDDHTEDDSDIPLSRSSNGNGGYSDWAVHDWDEEQGTSGSVLIRDSATSSSGDGYNIYLYAQKKNYEESSDSTESIVKELDAYFDASRTLSTNTKSTQYNGVVIANTSLNDWRIWLPRKLEVIAPKSNDVNKTSLITSESGMDDDGNFQFVLPYSENSSRSIDTSGTNKTTSEATWQGGDQISFLFALKDENGEVIKVSHDPLYDGSTYSDYATTPLYALRLKDPNDLTSLDMWSFKVQDIKQQRGGVTILNNVINASNSEKTVVQVELKNAGNLNVVVMTLDGNIVQYLQKGKATRGNHYYSWDGKTKSGKEVARGLYFIRVFGSGIDETRKVMVVKD